MTSGCLRGARRENNGSPMHSQTSQVCPGIQENGEGADDREQEEVHLKAPHSNVRRNARQLRVRGSLSRRTATCRERFEQLINQNATHDSSDSEYCGGIKSRWRRSVDKTAACSAARHIEARSPSCWSEEMCGGQSDVLVNKESSCDSSSSTPDPVAVAWREGDDACARRCDGGAARC